MKGKIRSLICVAVLTGALAGMTAFPLLANADIIAVTGSDLVGMRTTPGGSGVIATDGWSDATEGGFKIAWVVSLSGTTWTYSYTVTDKDGTPLDPGASHLLLEVSPFFTDDQLLSVTSGGPVNLAESPKKWEKDPNFVGSPSVQANADACAANPATKAGSNNGNPCLPADIFALKFDSGGPTYTFTTDKAPVWGDFYVKDGSHDSIVAIAYNTGFGTDPTAADSPLFTKWVPTPDTTNTFPPQQEEVPEPGSLILGGSTLVALGALAWRRGRRK